MCVLSVYSVLACGWGALRSASAWTMCRVLLDIEPSSLCARVTVYIYMSRFITRDTARESARRREFLCMCARVCAREPRVCASAPPYTRPGSASGAWHVWQAAGGARGPRGGTRERSRSHTSHARTTCPRRHSDSANSWVNFQHLPSTLLPRLSPYLLCTRGCTTLSHTAVRPSCKMENVLDAERCLAIHGQWTMDSESQAPAGCMLLRSSTSGKVDVLGGGTWFPRALCCAESVAGTSGHRKRYRLHDWKRFRDSAPRLRQTTLRSAYATF